MNDGVLFFLSLKNINYLLSKKKLLFPLAGGVVESVWNRQSDPFSRQTADYLPGVRMGPSCRPPGVLVGLGTGSPICSHVYRQSTYLIVLNIYARTSMSIDIVSHPD